MELYTEFCSAFGGEICSLNVYIQIFWDCTAVEAEVPAPYSEGSMFKSLRGDGLY